MKLNRLEFALMNNPMRAASQRYLETPWLIGRRGALAGQQVLEVGAGRGIGVEILASLGAARVTGFDLDPKMVKLAEARLETYGDRARVFVGDAEAIEVLNATYDTVVEYGLLHHLSNWPQAMREIARVLKPGGAFYFEDVLKGFTTPWPARVLFDHPQAKQFYGREFRAGLEAAGLCVEWWRQFGEGAMLGRAVKPE